jgi:hypothetical protein
MKRGDSLLRPKVAALITALVRLRHLRAVSCVAPCDLCGVSDAARCGLCDVSDAVPSDPCDVPDAVPYRSARRRVLESRRRVPAGAPAGVSVPGPQHPRPLAPLLVLRSLMQPLVREAKMLPDARSSFHSCYNLQDSDPLPRNSSGLFELTANLGVALNAVAVCSLVPTTASTGVPICTPAGVAVTADCRGTIVRTPMYTTIDAGNAARR